MITKLPGRYPEACYSMMVLYFSCLLLTICYVALMGAWQWGWQRQPEFKLPDGYEPQTFISVIIPARNEAQNIGKCIKAILAQKYPKHLLEIIVVDDHSEDDTAGVVKAFSVPQLKCFSLKDFVGETKTIAYKKAAITAGISQSKGTLIVTTDADCIAQENWLQNIAAIFEKEHQVMVVAPVIFSCDNSLIQRFQLIDFMSMQGITAAAHKLRLGNMCNGANLAFSKAAFMQIGGYEGVNNMASGDDYLLMLKLNKSMPGKIAYLKSQQAIVSTPPQPDWGSFMQQRIRWSSKSGRYNDARLTMILILVYLFNLSFLVLAILGIFNPVYLQWLLVMLSIKILVEHLFLGPIARFFGKKNELVYFILLQPVHIIYIVIAGFLGFIGGYKWKGRRVR